MNKYAYVTLLTDNNYWRGVLILKECLRRVQSEHPLVCLVTDNVSEQSLNILKKANIETRVIPRVETPTLIYEHNRKNNPRMAEVWKYVLTKFEVFRMVEFEKIIFLDADLYILKNLDHCFNLPHLTAALDGEYCSLWPKWPHFNSGFMVIQPKEELYSDLIKFADSLNPEEIYDYKGDHYVIADQEILNLYYKDWPRRTELHLNKYYNVFAVHIPEYLEEDIMENSYFIHFVGIKPWQSKEVTYSKSESGKQLVFNSVTDDGIKTYCWRPYEEALALVEACIRNDYQDLDWEKMLSNGAWEYYVAERCLSIFRDYEEAKKWINQAFQKTPTDPYILQLREIIEAHIITKRLFPLLKGLLKESLEEKFKNHKPSLKSYVALDYMEKLKWYQEDAHDIVSTYWSDLLTCLDSTSYNLYRI